MSLNKYFGVDFHHNLMCIEKMINRGGKLILVLKITISQRTSGCGIKRLASLLLSYIVVKFGTTTYPENCD